MLRLKVLIALVMVGVWGLVGCSTNDEVAVTTPTSLGATATHPPTVTPTATPDKLAILRQMNEQVESLRASEDATLAGLGVMAQLWEALLAQQPSLNFSAETTATYGSEISHEIVEYDNFLQDEELWKASGVRTQYSSGIRITFDSQYGSSCLKVMQPEVGPWVYHAHQGWANHDNPDVFTPSLPMTFLIAHPTPEWKVIAVTDSEVVLSHAPLDNGLTMTLILDKESHLPVRVEMTSAGDEASIVTKYSRYGQVGDLEVHESRVDCKARNLKEDRAVSEEASP